MIESIEDRLEKERCEAHIEESRRFGRRTVDTASLMDRISALETLTEVMQVALTKAYQKLDEMHRIVIG